MLIKGLIASEIDIDVLKIEIREEQFRLSGLVLF